ncbi:MAG: RNA polymerase factor sigma-54 [Paludibacteraceae bacterium]|nr:RNA polymerase factor sigma-54 [Paludibacteraceae bacterium]MBO7258523.1 RNA polymerase factor sigma-54 [Paludibacteraceae bacterium]
MLKLEQQQKLQQKLSPAQIQVIRMLELPTLEFEERIQHELEENPVLEEASSKDEFQNEEDEYNDPEGRNELENEDFNLDEYISDDEVPDYRLHANNYSRDDKQEDIPFSSGMTFHEYLIDQLGLQNINEQEKQIAEFIIGNIDEDGYLRRSVESITDDLAFQVGLEITDDEVLQLVRIIQQFDPPGVGAVSLQDCLLMQLQRKEKQTEDITYAIRILTDYFEEFSKKHYEKIKHKLSLTEEQLKRVIAEIVKLNPKPGSAWSGNIYEKNMTALVPDFMVENHNGTLHLSLNNLHIPELRISREYSELLEDYSSNKANRTREMKDAVTFVKQKIDSARWFIDAVKQRNETLLKTMTAILDFQKDFFVEGDETYLKPMILKDIADMTGFDISTISRVSNSKYVQTEYGIFSLKFFFSEAMTNDAGEEVSTREIKKILQEAIDAENKKRPLTDDQLKEVLKIQGYIIARRTVAKYREQLNIPVARLRKEV